MTLMRSEDTATVRKNTEIVLSQIDRIAKLIRSLLNLARGDETKTVKAVDAQVILNEVTDLLSPEFAKAHINFENQIPAQTFVLAEAGPLHQVFLNLLVNAVHAIQSQVRKGKTEGHQISVSAKTENGFKYLDFSDTGCGIPEPNMKLLFKPFFTTKEIGQGTGLGLATSYRLVEAWGGEISVFSEVGVGSTFTLKLKRATANAS